MNLTLDRDESLHDLPVEWDDASEEHYDWPRFALRLGIALCFGICVLSLFAVVRSWEGAVLGLLAVVMMAIVSAPIFMWHDYRILEPLTFVAVMTIIGCTFKLLYVLAFVGERDYVDTILLNGEHLSVLIYGSAVVTFGIACFVVGYWRRGMSVHWRTDSLFRFPSWSGKKVALVSLLIVIVSGGAFVRFVQLSGVSLSSPEELSQKRFIDLQDQSGREFRDEALQSEDYYYYRVAAFSKFAFFLSLAWLVFQQKPVVSWHGLIVFFSGVQTLAVFTFMNSRASVALVILDALVIAYFLSPRISWWMIGAGGATLAVLMLIQLKSRSQNETDLMQLVEKTVAGRDLMDISKMAIIIGAVPQQMDYCYGETLWGWLAAPIPKSFWPGKPVWTERGVFVNQQIYGSRNSLSGITLGLPAELYWNFGWIGVGLGMYLMGVVLRHFYQMFQTLMDNPSAVLIYGIILTRLTIFTLGTDVGTGILKTVLDLIPLIVLLLLVQNRNEPEHFEVTPAEEAS